MTIDRERHTHPRDRGRTLDDEILATENVVQAAREAATEHAERVAKDLGLVGAGLDHYRSFLDGTVANARSTLARCRELVSSPPMAGVVQGLLAGVRESVRLMYVAMIVVERCAGAGGREAGEREAVRSCSFCGKSSAEEKLVAGPAANICAACARLACGVLGIG